MSKFHELFCTCNLWRGSDLSVLLRQSPIRYAGLLPVSWMTSCLHIMEPEGQNQRQRCVSLTSPGGSTGGKLACRFVRKNFSEFIRPITTETITTDFNDNDNHLQQRVRVYYLLLHMAVHHHHFLHHHHYLSLLQSFIPNLKLGFLANPFHHRPFPYLSD